MYMYMYMDVATCTNFHDGVCVFEHPPGQSMTRLVKRHHFPLGWWHHITLLLHAWGGWLVTWQSHDNHMIHKTCTCNDPLNGVLEVTFGDESTFEPGRMQGGLVHNIGNISTWACACRWKKREISNSNLNHKSLPSEGLGVGGQLCKILHQWKSENFLLEIWHGTYKGGCDVTSGKRCLYYCCVHCTLLVMYSRY